MARLARQCKRTSGPRLFSRRCCVRFRGELRQVLPTFWSKLEPRERVTPSGIYADTGFLYEFDGRRIDKVAAGLPGDYSSTRKNTGCRTLTLSSQFVCSVSTISNLNSGKVLKNSLPLSWPPHLGRSEQFSATGGSNLPMDPTGLCGSSSFTAGSNFSAPLRR